MAKVNIYIFAINNISNTLEVTYYLLKMTPRNVIRTWDRKTTIFVDSIIDFSTRE